MRKRGKAVDLNTRLIDLAGNGQCLPDLASMMLPAILMVNAPWFKDPMDHSRVDFAMPSSASAQADLQIVVDHDDVDAAIQTLGVDDELAELIESEGEDKQ